MIVVGRRLRGSVDAEEEPKLVLDASAVRSLGATSLAEVLRAVAPAARWGGADEPITLLNGRRVGGFAAIAGIPPEALERVDVLPGPAALKLGYPPDRGVINFVTFRRFRSKQADVTVGTTTEGGATNVRMSGGSTRISGDDRLILSAEVRSRAALPQSRRALPPINAGALPVPAGDPASLREKLEDRDLLPSEVFSKLDGSWAFPAGAKAFGTASMSLETTASSSVQGDLGISPYVIPLSLRSRTLRSILLTSLQLDGFEGAANWNAILEYERGVRSSRNVASASLGPSDPGAEAGSTPDPTDMRLELELARSEFAYRSDTDRFTGTFVAGSPLVVSEARRGSITASLRAERLRGKSDLVVGRFGFLRRVVEGSISLSVPVSDAELRLPLLPGALSVNASAGFHQATGFGVGSLLGYGATWSPLPEVQVIWSVSEQRTAPSPDQLYTPTTVSVGVPAFDPLLSDTYAVATRSGGSPSLRPEQVRTSVLGLSIQPFSDREFRLGANLTRTATRDRIFELGQLTSRLQAVYPGRFPRDPSGRLISLDLSPVNLPLQHSVTLAGQISYSGPLRFWSSAKPRGDAASMSLSLSPVMRLYDRAQFDAGSATLDLLRGELLSGYIPSPRFEQTALIGISRSGAGLNISFRHLGASRIADERAASDLRFAPLTTFGLDAFASPAGRNGQGTTKTTFKLRVENVANRRQKVRDRIGSTPDRFRGAYLDPLGRTVSLIVRHVF